VLDTELLNPNLIPVEECGIGQRSLRYDIDYKAIAALSASEMVRDMTVFFTNDMRNKKKDITEENIRKEFDNWSTKKVIRKLVHQRRERIAEGASLPNECIEKVSELRSQVRRLQDTVRYLKSRCGDGDTDEYEQLKCDAMVGKSFIVYDKNLSAEVIDKYLFDTLKIAARDANSDDRLEAGTRHQLYILVLYCEQCFPKFKMSSKKSYDLSDIKKATASSEALEQCLVNMYSLVEQFIPKVRDAAVQGVVRLS
jgi:hypothetical protein